MKDMTKPSTPFATQHPEKQAAELTDGLVQEVNLVQACGGCHFSTDVFTHAHR